MLRYSYNTKLNRFRDLTTGRFVSQKTIFNVVETTIETSFSRLDSYLSALYKGTISIPQYQETMIYELRNLHVQMTILGGGGRNNITPSIWGKLGANLKQEYKYLEGFMRDLPNLTERQARARARMYANKIWNSYAEARRIVFKQAGYTMERRVLQPAEHCQDCIDIANKGWQPLGTLPLPADGSTECLSNCRCLIEYK